MQGENTMKGALLVIIIAAAIYFFLFNKQAEKTLEVSEKGATAIQKARNSAQFANWSHITQALSHYMNDNGSYPDRLADLMPRYIPLERHLRDPWGTPVRYEKSDTGVILTSAGPDREFDTEDDQTKEI